MVWGAGSVAGGQQYSDEIKKITKQRASPSTTRCGSSASRSRPSRRSTGTSPKRRSTLIAVDYEVLPFVLEQEDALKPGAAQIWPEGQSGAQQSQRGAAASAQRRGNVDGGVRRRGARVRRSLLDLVRAQRADGTARRAWRTGNGDKLTVYTPTGGIANCRHDMARDLGIPEEKVRVVCQYMGGNFGNKNQNQDADLIAAVLAKEAGGAGEAGAVAAAKTSSACTAAGRPSTTTRSRSTPTAR